MQVPRKWIHSMQAEPGLSYEVIPEDEQFEHEEKLDYEVGSRYDHPCRCRPDAVYDDPENQNIVWMHKLKQ